MSTTRNCGLTIRRKATVWNRCLRRANAHVDNFGTHALIYLGRIYAYGNAMTGKWEVLPMTFEKATGTWTATPNSFRQP